jgi:hypothetical protein
MATWIEKKVMYVDLSAEDKDLLIAKINEATATRDGLQGDLEATVKTLKSAIASAENTISESLRTLGHGKMNKPVNILYLDNLVEKKAEAWGPDGARCPKFDRDLTAKEIEKFSQVSLFAEFADGVVPAIVVEGSEDGGEIDTAATEGETPDEED